VKQKVRFAVLCDLHVERAGDFHSRYFAEALRQAAAATPDFIVLLGDLTARGGAEALGAVAEMAKSCPIKTLFLPGNSDVRDTPIETYRTLIGVERFAFRQDGILFLGLDTSLPSIGDEQRQWLGRQLAQAEASRLVVFTHVPARKLEKGSRAFLERLLSESRAMLCVAGHSHRPEVSRLAGCEVHTVGGTDPFKPVPAQPGFDLFTVTEAGEVRAQRRPITLLSATQVEAVISRLGAAPRAFQSPEQLVQCLERSGLRHVQVKEGCLRLPGMAEQLNSWSRRTPGAAVSIHLQSLHLDESGGISNRADLLADVEGVLALKAAFVTVHLPKTDSALVLDERGSVAKNPFTARMLGDFAALLRPLAERGVGIHLENLRSRREGLPDERCLGVVPSHLVAFRKALDDLLGTGRAGIGFTLDVGHAWGNGALASPFPVYKWFEALRPHVLSLHLHDMVPCGGKQITHQPLGSKGGTVGLEGVFFLLMNSAPQTVVYLEMLNLPDIAPSLDHIRRWAGQVAQLR